MPIWAAVCFDIRLSQSSFSFCFFVVTESMLPTLSWVKWCCWANFSPCYAFMVPGIASLKEFTRYQIKLIQFVEIRTRVKGIWGSCTLRIILMQHWFLMPISTSCFENIKFGSLKSSQIFQLSNCSSLHNNSCLFVFYIQLKNQLLNQNLDLSLNDATILEWCYIPNSSL